MKNICIVGYGAIAVTHIASLSEIKSINLYAVCDIDNEKLKKAEKDFSVTYNDFDLMLKDEKIDVVHICTPHCLHFEMIKKALKANKGVVCEKPVTMTEEEYDELLKLENADKVCVVMQNRLNPSIKRLKEIADSGDMGKVLTVKGVLTWSRDIEYYRHDAWRGKFKTEGGGLLINQAVHTLDFFSYLIGDIKSVKATMCNFSLPEIEVEDTMSAYLGFEKGLNGIFFATNAYGKNSAPEFEVVFEKGKLRYMDNKLFLNRDIIEEDHKATEGKAYWGRSHKTLLKNYYENNIFFSPYDVKNTMKTMFAIYKSAKSGKEIKL